MSTKATVFFIALALAASGCASDMNKTQKGALVGTGVGGATGALLGQAIGKDTTSTVIGGLAGAAAGGLIGGAIGNYMDKQEQELQQVQNLSRGAKVQRRQNELQITLRSDVLFDVNSATLKPGALDEIDQVADTLVRYPETKVVVDGHTDSSGSDDHNLRLSEDRALSVRDELVRAGVDSRRITTRGYGETRPVATNSTDVGRQQNRRVAITIIPIEKQG